MPAFRFPTSLLALLGLLLIALPGLASTEKRHALVIGNNGYQNVSRLERRTTMPVRLPPPWKRPASPPPCCWKATGGG